MTVRGFRVSSSSENIYVRLSGSSLIVSDMEYEGGTMAVYARDKSALQVSGANHIVFEDHTGFMGAEFQGFINCFGATVTLVRTPAFSIAFSYSTILSNILVTAMNFVGDATGRRYNVNANSVISNTSGDSDHFPGTLAGLASNGGEYI